MLELSRDFLAQSPHFAERGKTLAHEMPGNSWQIYEKNQTLGSLRLGDFITPYMTLL